jgi:uncharacterized membrane protein
MKVQDSICQTDRDIQQIEEMAENLDRQVVRIRETMGRMRHLLVTSRKSFVDVDGDIQQP